MQRLRKVYDWLDIRVVYALKGQHVSHCEQRVHDVATGCLLGHPVTATEAPGHVIAQGYGDAGWDLARGDGVP